MFRQSTKKSSKSNDARRKRPDRKPEKKRKRREVKLLGGLAAGVIGGIVATWALDRYQEGSLEAGRRADDETGAVPGTVPIVSRRQEDQLQAQRRTAAPIVHYAVGALTGGIYGLTAEVLPIVRRGYGTGYSNLLFLGGSEALLPWFNVGRTKARSTRSGGLTAPLVYGAVLETTRRVLRWIL